MCVCVNVQVAEMQRGEIARGFGTGSLIILSELGKKVTRLKSVVWQPVLKNEVSTLGGRDKYRERSW